MLESIKKNKKGIILMLVYFLICKALAITIPAAMKVCL